MKLVIDTESGTLTKEDGATRAQVGLFTKEAFEAISLEWIRVGYSLAYYHSFSWFGLPILQLPEDLLRVQEVIFDLKPELIVETGVFQGGSLLFYASMLELLGKGRVIGIDVQIPAFVRQNIEQHPLAGRISLIEGSSVDQNVVNTVKAAAQGVSPVMVMLDSDHTRTHVTAELESYAPLVTPGSWIIAADGYMKDIWDVPRAVPEWKDDNPWEAAKQFAEKHPEFRWAPPKWLYSEGKLTENVTYFPGGWLQRIA